MEFVEGNAELTPARLAGHFDPAQVMESGYSSDVWVDGPLVRALREGRILYLEEINRVPEETLNLLVTVMSERELTVPRLGRVAAHDDFRLVAAMNPFDAVGTARIAGAIYDRVNRLSVGYQTEAEELAIVEREAGTTPLNERAVKCVRLTRSHNDIRVGSSIRGAIDLVLLADQLRDLRGLPEPDHDCGLDAATTALSGRIRLHESSGRTPEDVVAEIWAATAPREDAGEESGKA
jgi:MoxR-like ATPase